MVTNLQGLREEFVVYRSEDFPRLLHALKGALAVILAMLISMRLELRGPGTAMVSAVIVSLQQQSGMVIARAFYRGIGFCGGSLIGLMLIGLFAQAPSFFLAGLALWIGFCVAGSSYYKNYQSYAFVLSGYVACITTLSDWQNPYDVIFNVIETLSEVVIGVGTGSLVSALVFPQKVVPSLTKWRDTALSSLVTALRAAALGAPLNAPMDRYLSLVNESVAIEGLRAAAVFEEPDMRLRDEALLTLDRTFLNTIASIYAVYRARQIAATTEFEGRERVEAIFARLADVVGDPATDAPGTEDGLDHLEARLQAFERALPAEVQAHADEAENDRVIEMGGAEAWLATSSLLEFCGACRLVLDPPSVPFKQSIVHAIAFMRSVRIHTSGIMALASGLRATTAVAVVGAAWLLSGWTAGYSAVVSAGITSGFFSIIPSPASASRQAFGGCLIACIVAFIVNFSLMPLFGDVSVLALCFGVVIFLGGYLAAIPGYVALGSSINIYFCYVLTPTNVAVYDPPAFLDRAFALLLGIGISAIAFALVVPREGERLAKRYATRIRELVQDAAEGEVDREDAAEIETAMRDLIVRITTVPLVSKDYLANLTQWAFGQLWMVNTLLQVRDLGAPQTHALPPAWDDAQRAWLAAMDRVAQQPERASIEAALAATERGLAVLATHAAVNEAGKTADENARGSAGNTAANPAGDYPAQTPATSTTLLKVRARLYSTRAALTDLEGNAARSPELAS
ncbi:FUSC family protein [Paraburkholderia sp. DHOC27]|uniref:FUSC family protein n=1 Tax=Paraburkholderia sp. DHOC27 TaxID=2303330 RepID=UPI000E3D931B|nr:FUSC family protein [Paraburkholderia sp. DHOC27]RFU49660.1 FUSC family protein [Paraburkholderia sp. DHOC27]